MTRNLASLNGMSFLGQNATVSPTRGYASASTSPRPGFSRHWVPCDSRYASVYRACGCDEFKMSELDSDQETYREGLFERALGRSSDSNPYPPNSKANVLWEKGWRMIDGGGENSPPSGSRNLVPDFTPASPPRILGHPPPKILSPSVRLFINVAINIAVIGLLFGLLIMTSR
jgi:hypothetical protein